MRLQSRTALLSVSAALLAASAAPDEVFLRGGGRVSGVVVERTRNSITIETAPGRLTLSMERVERIVESRSAVEDFQERAKGLVPGDAQGWAALARWAAERDLLTHSREAWQRVLAADPAHPETNDALGRVELDGSWVSREEAYRARGYVEYEGRWVTPAEHEALLRQREADEAAFRESREADFRVREAEARAREAEARAREAEAATQPVDGGIPLWWALGGGYLPYPIEAPPVVEPPSAGGPGTSGGHRPAGPHHPAPKPSHPSEPSGPPPPPHRGVVGPAGPSGPAGGTMLPTRPEQPSSRPDAAGRPVKARPD